MQRRRRTRAFTATNNKWKHAFPTFYHIFVLIGLNRDKKS